MIGLSYDFKPLSYWLVLIVNIYMLWCTRNNLMMFLITFIITYSNYSIIFANYIYNIDDVIYTQVITQKISNQALNILTIFNLSLLVFIDWLHIPNMKFVNLFYETRRQDNIVLTILTVILIFIFFYGFKLPDVTGERGSPQPIYEYAVSVFIIYFYYSGNKISIFLGLFLVIIYSFQNFIFGGRIYGIQFILTAFLMLYVHKFTIKKLLVYASPFFILFNIIGILRGNFLIQFGDIEYYKSTFFKTGLSLDTAYSSYYTSQAIIYASNQISFSEKIHLFGDFIISIFLGESSNPNSIPQNIAYNYMHHSYGCVMPFYFYFYFGAFGSLLCVFILKFYFKIICKLRKTTHGCLKCIGVFIITHSFRWYLYSPLGLFRGVLFLVIIYYMMHVVHSLFMSKRINV